MARNGQLTEMFEQLEYIRRQRDWTYLELTEAIAAVTHRRRDEDCWRRICKGLVAQPQERTIDILEAFLASVRPNGKGRARRAS